MATIDPRAQLAFDEGLTAAKEHKFDVAIKAFQQSLRYAPEHADTWYNLMCSHKHANEIDKAIGAGQRAVKINPKFPHLQHCMGDMYLAQHAVPHAVDAFIEAIDQEPQNMVLHVLLGNAFEQMRLYDMAYECFHMGVKLGAERSTLFTAMAYVAAHMCDWPKQQFAEAGFLREAAAGRNHGAPFQTLTLSGANGKMHLEAATNHFKRLHGDVVPMPKPGPISPDRDVQAADRREIEATPPQ